MSRRALALSVAAVVVLSSVPAAALAAPTWLSPQPLSAAGGTALSGDLAADASGDVVAVWSRQESGVPRVQAALRPAGGNFGAPQTLSPPGGAAGAPRVAVNAAGEAVAAWQRFDGSNTRIQVARGTVSGGFGEARTASVLGQNAHNPQVAIDAAGEAIVAWERDDGATGRVDVSIWPRDAVCCAASVLSGAGDAEEPRVAVNPDGDAIAVWSEVDGANSLIHAAARQAGGGFSSGTPVSTPGANAEEPEVAIDDSGEAAVVWIKSDGSNFRVQTAWRRLGGGFDSPLTLSAPGQSAFRPDVAVDGAGEAITAWQRSDGSHVRIQAVTTPPQAFPDMPPQTISVAGQNAFGAEVGLDPTGEAVAVWQRSDGSDVRIQAATRPTAGAFGAPVTISPAGGDAEEPQLALDSEGNAAAAWARFDGSELRVEAAGYDAAPPRLQALAIPAAGALGAPLAFSVTALDVWSPAAVQWSFGDGSATAGAAASHAYAAAGTYTATATATDAVGNSSSAGRQIAVAVAGGAGAPGPHGKHTWHRALPRLLRASLSPRSFRPAPPHRRSAGGATLRFTLTTAAKVAFSVERGLPGRRADRDGRFRCLKPTPRLRHQRRCLRFRAIGALPPRQLDAGPARIHFDGWLGRHPLSAGRYHLRLRAKAADGRRSPRPTVLPFTVRARQPR